MSVQPIPYGYHSITPYLIVDGASAAIEYYVKAFDATEVLRLDAPGEKVGHAEIRIGDSHVMLADEFPEMDAKGPKAYGGSPMSLMIYVEDVDKVFRQAVEAGGEELRPVHDQFYGDRTGTVKDPFGHTWTIATHVEDVDDEVIKQRYDEWLKKNT
jgi:PhnB protein